MKNIGSIMEEERWCIIEFDVYNIIADYSIESLFLGDIIMEFNYYRLADYFHELTL